MSAKLAYQVLSIAGTAQHFASVWQCLCNCLPRFCSMGNYSDMSSRCCACMPFVLIALDWSNPTCVMLQFAFNTLQRVTPVSHGVCNVVKRVVIIGTSVVFFGNKLTDKTKIGTVVALIGTYLYTEATKRNKVQQSQKPGPPATGASPATA